MRDTRVVRSVVAVIAGVLLTVAVLVGWVGVYHSEHNTGVTFGSYGVELANDRVGPGFFHCDGQC